MSEFSEILEWAPMFLFLLLLAIFWRPLLFKYYIPYIQYPMCKWANKFFIWFGNGLEKFFRNPYKDNLEKKHESKAALPK